MVTADTFVRELEEKNQGQIRNLLAAYGELLTKEALAPADLLRLEQKTVIERIEVAALWIADNDDWSAKLSLAASCGDGARQFSVLAGRLQALGLPPESYDPRFGGYSKLFAFFRSLQSPEERASASAVTLGNITVQRLGTVIAQCEAKEDAETAQLVRDEILAAEERHLQEGRRALVATTATEESQARARRAAFKTIELLGESYEGSVVRRFLQRSLRK